MNVVSHDPPLKRIDLSPVRKAAPREPLTLSEVSEMAMRTIEEARIWEAVTATAQASQQGETE